MNRPALTGFMARLPESESSLPASTLAIRKYVFGSATGRPQGWGMGWGGSHMKAEGAEQTTGHCVLDAAGSAAQESNAGWLPADAP